MRSNFSVQFPEMIEQRREIQPVSEIDLRRALEERPAPYTARYGIVVTAFTAAVQLGREAMHKLRRHFCEHRSCIAQSLHREVQCRNVGRTQIGGCHVFILKKFAEFDRNKAPSGVTFIISANERANPSGKRAPAALVRHGAKCRFTSGSKVWRSEGAMCQQRDYAGPAVRLGRTSCKPLT